MVNLKLDTLYEDQVLKIQLDKTSYFLQLTFLATPDLERFRIGNRLATDIALAKDVRFWLTDARKIKGMLPENQTWLAQHMAPLLQAQIRKFAIVMAPECFVMTSPNKVYEKPAQENEAPANSTIKVHFNMEAASDWLFSDT